MSPARRSILLQQARRLKAAIAGSRQIERRGSPWIGRCLGLGACHARLSRRSTVRSAACRLLLGARLLRGACHRAGQGRTRWLAMTAAAQTANPMHDELRLAGSTHPRGGAAVGRPDAKRRPHQWSRQAAQKRATLTNDGASDGSRNDSHSRREPTSSGPTGCKPCGPDRLECRCRPCPTLEQAWPRRNGQPTVRVAAATVSLSAFI